MAASDSRELFDRVPRWWTETVLGLSLIVGGVLGMGLGSAGAGRMVELLFGPTPSSAFVFESAIRYGLALLLTAFASATVGIGITDAYLTYRAFDPGFVVEWPNREAARWLTGLGALVVLLVGLGALVKQVTGPADAGWEVPAAVVMAQTFGTLPTSRGLPLPVSGAFSIVVLAGVVGPTVGVLFHGVLQNSLRQIAPIHVAVGGTALAVAVLASGPTPPGSILVAAVVATAGYAYERTENLVIPMVAYAVLNAVTLTTALLFILSAAGKL